MQSELKPCAHCGGEAEYHSDKGPTGEVYAWVGCNQCDAMSVHCDVRSMQPEETHPIEAWNNRASDAEIARLTEALRAAEEREKALRGKFLTIADDAGETYLAWVENGCDPADAIRVIGWVEDFSRRSSQEPSHEAS